MKKAEHTFLRHDLGNTVQAIAASAYLYEFVGDKCVRSCAFWQRMERNIGDYIIGSQKLQLPEKTGLD